MSDGMFFAKRPQHADGRYFRDQLGRDSADFHKAAERTYDVTKKDPGATAPPAPPSPETQAAPVPMPKMARAAEKYAFDTWFGEMAIPNGFHRPTREQPDAQEAGAQRFHSSEATLADFGANKGLTHGIVEGGGLKQPLLGSSQMGKNASVAPFLGTTFAKAADVIDDAEDDVDKAKDTAMNYGGQILGGAKDALGSLTSSAGSALQSVAKNKWAALGATVLGLHAAKNMGKKTIGAIGRGAGRLVGRAPAKTEGLLARAARKYL